ncbi:SDR family oxidoreductase [Amycolatopsis rubida]|uniref:SDR family oxidoreductase n=1 Tax=Amycolatopsis rubida TaxID=112413 RepID=A0ABX0C915_9PSEU|nr:MULTISPECIES: SDR family oxidoreductase [Amycolatopsis]MYW97837.1 SDR family oxidoreductase [Amycolatopsis rubida]NEC62823.1 SDR family oxidoreductase [Amycolatopsis rubida]OAP24040.1 3-oxoacyl-[acyl-carrier-protein] reductase FabG [Amycolatopsis sp. M39]
MPAARTVLITGGAGGIGRAIGAAFAQAGDSVVLADLDGAEEAAKPVGGRGIRLDITDEAAISAALDEVGPVDVLVNNAGLLSVHGRLLDLPGADLLRVLSTNVHGTFLMTQLVARRMVERRTAGHGEPGVVVNLSSIGGRQPTPGMGGYESSKAAVDALTRWAALELAEHSIRVNAVAPGPVATPMLAAAMPPGSPAHDAWVARIPDGRMAAVEDVAAAVVFLASPAAAHITGTSLPVDGGQLLT